AQKAAGAGAAAAAPKGEKKAAPKAKAAAATAAAGDRPPIEQMLKALHEGKPASETAPKPKLPAKLPLPARRAEPVVVSRRSFPVEMAMATLAIVATPFAAGMTLIAIISGLWGLLTARFMMPNMIVELPSKFKVGPASDFPIGTVSEKYKASRG